jgi:(R)-amidase
MRSVRVLLAQLAPATHDVTGNVTTACRLLDEHPDADLAVFPELYVQAYALKGLAPLEPGARALGPLFDAAARRRTAVMVGLAERVPATGDRARGGHAAGAAAMANTAVCIDEQGSLVASYRKVHLFGAEHRYFAAGGEYLVVPLAGVRVGPLVCYDLEFPEPARTLATAGAELLVTLSANMDPYAEDHALFLRVRALENGLPHVYVNCVGQEGRLRFCGGSAVADAAGRVVAQLPAYAPDVRVVDVPVDGRGGATGQAPPEYLSDRRSEVTARVVRPGRAAMTR